MAGELSERDPRYFTPPLWTLAVPKILFEHAMPAAAPKISRSPDGKEPILLLFRDEMRAQSAIAQNGWIDCIALIVPSRDRLIDIVSRAEVEHGFKFVGVDRSSGDNGWTYRIEDYLAIVRTAGN